MKPSKIELFNILDEKQASRKAGAKARYQRKLFKLYVELYSSTDSELIDYCNSCLAAGETKSGIVKRLIRNELKRIKENSEHD